MVVCDNCQHPCVYPACVVQKAPTALPTCVRCGVSTQAVTGCTSPHCPVFKNYKPGAMVSVADHNTIIYKGSDVEHPKHYSRWSMEPIEFIAINDLPWWLANVIKYTMRYDAKNGLEDLYKARSYLDMKIRQLEGHNRFWDKPVSEERKLNKK